MLLKQPITIDLLWIALPPVKYRKLYNKYPLIHKIAKCIHTLSISDSRSHKDVHFKDAVG